MSLRDADLRGRIEDEPEAARAQPEPVPSPVETAESVASSVGNRAFGQLIGRTPGDGITARRRRASRVASTIATNNGSGHTLEPRTRDRLAPTVGDPLADVRVHTDATADSLARSVSARAFTTGTDVYFASGRVPAPARRTATRCSRTS